MKKRRGGCFSILVVLILLAGIGQLGGRKSTFTSPAAVRTPAAQSIAVIASPNPTPLPSATLRPTPIALDVKGTVNTSSPVPTTALQLTPNPSSTPTPAPTPRPTPTPVPTPTYRDLASGAKGEDVRELQERLVQLGYAIGSADGQYGGKTEAAVKAVQVLAGLRVTGTADEETQEVIWGRDAPTPQPKPTPTPKPTPRPTPEPEPEDEGTDYILNKNTGKFHYSWCSSVDQMKESNKIYFTGTSEQAQRKGYVPCKRCNP